jgi:phosphoribosylanthranilate isomerase
VSEDALTADEARDLARLAPPYVSTVLVTHLEAAAEILQLAAFVGVDTIQIHGLVEPSTVADVLSRSDGRKVTKAIHVTGPEALQEAESVLDICHALHLDSRTSDRLGGTGKVHDWSISGQIVETASKQGRKPVILSGGLRPTNVAEAISAVRPFAVDVNSGVEDENGDKDFELAMRFLSHARPD